MSPIALPVDMTAFPAKWHLRRCIFPAQRLKNIMVKDGDHISIAGKGYQISTDAFGYRLKPFMSTPSCSETGTLNPVIIQAWPNTTDRPHYPNKRPIEWLLHILPTRSHPEIVEFDERVNAPASTGSYTRDMYQQHELCLSPEFPVIVPGDDWAAYFTRAWGEDMTCEETRCQSWAANLRIHILLPVLRGIMRRVYR